MGSQRSALESLIIAMIEHEQAGRLCAYPFPSLQDLVDEILCNRTEEVVDIGPQQSYHKVLFSWRVRHGDFQGAAAIMYHRLQLLRNVSSSQMDVDAETTEIAEAYLAIINALSCVAKNNAWIFAWTVVDKAESPASKRVRREEKSMSLILERSNGRKSNSHSAFSSRYSEGIWHGTRETTNYPWKSSR
jgi:hypothetical protein